MPNKFLINVHTAWCGEDNTYAAIAKWDSDLDNLAEDLAYTNFSDFGGANAVLEDLFPDVDEYTDSMIEQAAEEEYSYYGYNIESFEGTDEEWGYYEIVYDCTREK